MSYKEFLIAPFNSGLENDLNPFLIPEDAFVELENAYIFRGRVTKKKGNVSYGRLKRFITNFDIGPSTSPTWTFNIFDKMGISATEPNAEIILSSVTITINAVTFTDPYPSTGVLNAGDPNNYGTIDYITGAVSITTTELVTANVYLEMQYYPTLPVMGLRTLELSNINLEKTIAFDTKYAYQYIDFTGWEEFDPPVYPAPPGWAGVTWSGSDSDFFWTCNFRGITSDIQLFWATNFNIADPIRYIGGANWVDFAPATNATDKMYQCRVMLPFKGRLLCFNTIEGTALVKNSYPQRVRFCKNGFDPTDQVTYWRDDVPGNGGYVEAATSEAIITVQIIKDRLIVYFERSTWELVYTGNEVLPFTFLQINSELGVESTFSSVTFDDGILGIGARGIHAANTNGVKRIDEKIPYDIFKIRNTQQGNKRVYGIRDFYNELVYWCIPETEAQKYPSKILMYNYQNNSFAYFTEDVTCFGYFQRTTGYTWATLPFATWAEWTSAWDSSVYNGEFQSIIVGNQQGYTSLMTTNDGKAENLTVTRISDDTYPTMYNTITSPNHNLLKDTYIKFILADDVGLPYENVYQVYDVIDSDNFIIDDLALPGYIGGASIIVLNNFNIRTKNFAPFSNMATNMITNSFKMLLERCSEGEVTLNMYDQSNYNEPLLPLMGDSRVRLYADDLDNFSPLQDQIWHTVYRNLVTSSFQLQFTLSDAQMRNDDIRDNPFILYALSFSAAPTGRLRR